MKKKKSTTQMVNAAAVYGDPVYGSEEDIYARVKKVEFFEEGDKTNDVINAEIDPGDDLDVPGVEMDDKDEKTGGEDEENNYYSIGGDNHNDLEEDKDE